MSFELCEKVRSLEPYDPISGSYRIRLDANESCFDYPQEIKAEIKEIIDSTSFNRYPDPTAKKLTAEFAAYYGISPDNVTVTNGSDEVLYLIASAILKRGSRVVVAEPDFSMYAFYSFLSENEISVYKKSDNSLNIDIGEFSELVREKNADMLIFSNPCNPTGQGITAQQAEELVKSCPDTLVVLDEAYMDFWDQSLIKKAADHDNLIVLRTASKAVGSAAIRLGFAVADEVITKALRAAKSPYNVNTLSQEIGRCIYSHGELLKKRLDEIVQNTKSLYDGISTVISNYQLPMEALEPRANFVFLKTEKAKDLYEYLLSQGIAVRCFAKYEALRITTGTEEENKAFLVEFEAYIIKNILKRNR